MTPPQSDHDRLIKLEGQLESVLAYGSRITKLERAMWILVGATTAAAVSGGASMLNLLLGG